MTIKYISWIAASASPPRNDGRKIFPFLFLSFSLLLSACGTEQPPYKGIKIGKPYEVAGHVYVPKYRPDYDEIGLASWYGPGFHGGRTASGERYDQNDMTAAHKTLPLPSLVRVTNLNNGRSAIVKINDRGPFVADRIIDLSHAAAAKLGILRMGTAKVRVQFLDRETREYVMSLPNGAESLKKLDMAAAQPENAGVSEASYSSSHPDIFSVADTQAATDAPQVFAAPAAVRTAELDPPAVHHAQAEVLPPPRYARRPQPQHAAADYRPAESGSYYVQAGTFGVKSNADRMFERLATAGYAKVIETGAGKHKLYRVLSGPYNSYTDAQTALRNIDVSGAKIIKD